MTAEHIARIAEELELKLAAVQATVELLKQDATIPFIARYRKEATDSLDEVAVTAIRDRLNQLEEMDARKATILKSLETHGHLTDELKEKRAVRAEYVGAGRHLPALSPQAQDKSDHCPGKRPGTPGT